MATSLKYKLVFFIPTASTQSVLDHLFTLFPYNVGRIGAYGRCAFFTRGTGQFMPMEGAQPVIGAVGVAERVEEDRVEVLVNLTRSPHANGQEAPEMHRIIAELKKVHPYEEVAYDVYRLEDF